MRAFADLTDRERAVWNDLLEGAALTIWASRNLTTQPGTVPEQVEILRRLRDAGEVEFVDLVDEDDHVVGFDILPLD